MKSSMPYHGVASPQMRVLMRPLYAAANDRLTERRSWEATVRELWDTASHREQRYAAIGLARLRVARPWQDTDTLTLYRTMVTTGAWWDYVDGIAAHLVGPIVLAHPDPAAPMMRDWATDDEMWIRRAAIIHQLGAKASTDTGLLAATIVVNLAGSRFGTELFIRKAIGWALRQYAYTDASWVRAFVDAHRARLAPLSVREALKHVGS